MKRTKCEADPDTNCLSGGNVDKNCQKPCGVNYLIWAAPGSPCLRGYLY